MPLQLASAREQLLAELDRLDEPLAARDDLERAIALLVELDVVRDRARIAFEIAALLQQLRNDRAAPSWPTGRPADRRPLARAPRRSDSHPGAPHVTGPSVPFG